MTNHNILLVGLLFAACSSSSLPGTGAPNGGTGGVLGASGASTGGVLDGTGGASTGGVLGGTGGAGTGGVRGGTGGLNTICDGVYCSDGHWTMGPCGPSGFAPPPGHVQCDLAKAGVECVTSGICPLRDSGVTDVSSTEVAPSIAADGGLNSCNNNCAADEICVAYYAGTCTSTGTSCRKVSASCQESVIVQGAACFEGPCNDDICGLKDGQHFWACNYAPCSGDTLRADAKCYGP